MTEIYAFGVVQELDQIAKECFSSSQDLLPNFDSKNATLIFEN